MKNSIDINKSKKKQGEKNPLDKKVTLRMGDILAYQEEIRRLEEELKYYKNPSSDEEEDFTQDTFYLEEV